MRVISKLTGCRSLRKSGPVPYRLYFLDEVALVGRPLCRSSSPLMAEYTGIAFRIKSKSRELYRPLHVRVPPSTDRCTREVGFPLEKFEQAQ